MVATLPRGPGVPCPRLPPDAREELRASRPGAVPVGGSRGGNGLGAGFAKDPVQGLDRAHGVQRAGVGQGGGLLGGAGDPQRAAACRGDAPRPRGGVLRRRGPALPRACEGPRAKLFMPRLGSALQAPRGDVLSARGALRRGPVRDPAVAGSISRRSAEPAKGPARQRPVALARASPTGGRRSSGGRETQSAGRARRSGSSCSRRARSAWCGRPRPRP